MKAIARLLKWVGTLLCFVLLLPIILVMLLYVPSIQNWVVQETVALVSEKTGFDVSLDRIRLSFPLDLKLVNLTAMQEGDTLLHANSIIVDLDFSKVLDKEIGVETFEIKNASFSSANLIPELTLNGSATTVQIGPESTNLEQGRALLSNALIDGCSIDISLADTTIIDTTTSAPLPWTIEVDNVNLRNTTIAFRSAGDTLDVSTHINRAQLKGANIDLLNADYKIERLGVHIDTLALAMQDSIGERKIVPLSSASLHLEGMHMDSVGIDLGKFDIATNTSLASHSHIQGSAHFDFDALTPNSEGRMELNTSASISHTDLLAIAQDFIPKDIAKIYPETPLKANVRLGGNIDSISIDTLHLLMPKVVDLHASGQVVKPLEEEERVGEMILSGKTMNLNFIKRYLQLSGVNIPSITLSAKANIQGNTYKADALLRQGKGTVRTKAYLDLDNMAYEANVFANELNIANFLPNDSIGHLTLHTTIKGRGIEPYSKATRFKGEVELKQLEYKHLNISNARLAALLKEGWGSVDFICDNDILTANACVGADISETRSKAEFSLSLNRINLQALGVVQDSVVASMVMSIDGNTDMKQNHRIDGSIHSMEIATRDTTFYPLDLNLEVKMNEKSMLARTNAGDMWIQFHADEGIDSLLLKTEAFIQEMNAQLEGKYHDYDKAKTLLPRVDMHVLCGNNNPLANITRSMLGATFNHMSLDFVCHPTSGINGQGQLNKFNTSAVVLDSISFNLKQLSDGIDLLARVKNGPRNKVVNFESTLKAFVSPKGINSSFLFIDGKGRKGVDFGLDLAFTDSVKYVHLTPLNPIIAYRRFDVNANNYVAIDKDNHVSADMNLIADDGTSVRLYSSPNENAMQDITLSVANFNLGELSNVMPFMPMITGMLNGDVHAVKEADMATVSVDMDVRKMGYEGSPLGDIAMEAIYFPNSDGSHLVDGILYQNQKDIAQLSGKYWSEGEEDLIEAEAQLIRLPMNIANGFVPDNLARLEGYLSGVLSVSGPVSSPQLSGAMATDSMHVCSDPYSIDLRLPDDTIVITNNFIDLDKIQAYANGNNPLTLDGTIDFRDVSLPKLDLSIIAREFNLINAPKRKGAEAYGKVYVDVFGRMQGTLNDLSIRGRLNVNGKTNVTYVMKDSPLIVEDQLNSMVTFTDFSDTTEALPLRIPEQNIKMDFQVNIDEATTVHCLMSEDGQDKIDLEGGGELRMTYDMLSGMKLFGRYTVLSGRMDYSLVVVSLKNFQIENGSYVEFMGDMMNPNLNISASERKKASVSNNNTTRTVNFDVGLKITQSLADLGLEFTLKAPEDITVQNELSAMSVEERGRAAVTMLTTGMYLSPNSTGNGGSFDATSALNSFLNSQISNIAGKALSTIDIGFGIDNSTSATGATQTDYNFSFAKRFWGNRISVIIGGKVSSGNDVQNTGMSIIDNVSVEYRLDNSGTRYVKAFYNKDTESILDSEVMEMGGSLVLRRKTENLSELFIFRDTKKTLQNLFRIKPSGSEKETPATTSEEKEQATKAEETSTDNTNNDTK